MRSHSPSLNAQPHLPQDLQSALVRFDQGWVRFRQPVSWIQTGRLEEVVASLERVEQKVEKGLFAVGFVAFEAAAAFDPVLVTHRPATGLPLLGFALFEQAEAEPHPFPSIPERAGPRWEIQEQESERRYLAAVDKIHREIADGTVYQVNYTFPLLVSRSRQTVSSTLPSHQPPEHRLFEQLCRAQGAAFGCSLTAAGIEIHSASPELFFELRGDRIATRPMKGTAPRGRFSAEDQAFAAALRSSQKDRAENLMIVDMMRNDLGRIARVGSVTVPALFTVERLPTLHQMTSTVTARTDAGLADIFTALFPCASISGAPKSSALKAIRGLETNARGVYTGAVGVVLPRFPERLGLFESTIGIDQGRFTPSTHLPATEPISKSRYARFNVAIRTAWRTDQRQPFYYGVGSGVVWDSDARAEYRECHSKALALTDRWPPFRLLETMLLRPPATRHRSALSRLWLLCRHLDRMQSSAQRFGFHFDRDAINDRLVGALECNPETGQRCRIRLMLDQLGQLEIEVQRFPRRPRRRVRVAIARQPIDSSNPHLFHKTTHRTIYTKTLSAAQRINPQVDDVVLINEAGQLTETCTANLILEPAATGRPWRTPPVTAGLLAGTLRQSLLDQSRLIEVDLYPNDLVCAKRALLTNSVRGFIPIEVVS